MTAKPNKRFKCPNNWTLAQRLDHYVDKSGGPDACWPWTGRRHPSGHGQLRLPGTQNKMVYAHRAAYTVHIGQIPDGLLVCHHCDHPPCCNPAHLWTDTIAGNLADMRAKGRQNRGEKNGHAKLTEELVRAIRAMRAAGALYKEIAARFGIHKTTARAIVVGRRWRHL